VTSHWWSDDDDQLLAAMGAALHEAQDVPPAFVAAGKAAYTWHTIDAELAALTYDSAADPPQQPALTRAERATLRDLTFSSTRVKIHLRVTDQALHGQVVPVGESVVELHTKDGPADSVTTDEDGWFVVRPIPIGSFRLLCRLVDGTAALTDWFAL
jgi:putative component of toxin-antitoxin plasmid stabilization module